MALVISLTTPLLSCGVGMTVYFLSPESSAAQVQATEKKLRRVIPDLKTIGNVETIAHEIKGAGLEKSIIIFASSTANVETVDTVINISSRYRDQIFFVLVSKEISASNYKRLVRSGADWISADGPAGEILEIISRQRPHTKEKISESKKPTVISFLPCAGGVGNTTIALEVAMLTKLSKATRSWRTCYVDLDFQTSHVCDFVDLEPRLQIQEIFEQPERLDQQLFELFANHHSSGLDIFAAPRSQLDLCEVNVAALDRFLGMISDSYDFVVIDLPVPWFRWTTPVLENSNAVIVTGLNTIPGLRQLKTTVEAVVAAQGPSTQLSIVVNRVNHNLWGGIRRRGHAEGVLAGQKLFYIRDDPEAVNRLNTGTPAAQAKSGRSIKDFVALASFCSGLKTAADSKKKE
jgi:pilus assembly protein CpaE